MNTPSKIFLFIALVYSVFCTKMYAQNEKNIQRKLEKTLIKDAQEYIFINDIIDDSASVGYALVQLQSYCLSSKQQVKNKAYNMAYQLGIKSENVFNRQQAVYMLVYGLHQNDEQLANRLYSNLEKFNSNDFNNEARDSIRSLLKPTTPYLKELIKLTGFLGLTDMTTSIRRVLASNKFSKSEKWAAQLALARMGDEQILNRIMENVKSTPVDDGLMYNLMPDLVYLKCEEVADYIAEIVFSDTKNCLPANPDATEKIPCAYRAMEYLAMMLVNFPYKIDVTGDLNTANYAEALLNVRNWLNENKGNYIIKINEF